MVTGLVGAPKGVQIKLESWEEGGYTILERRSKRGNSYWW